MQDGGYKWLNSMVYGRYNYIDDYMVNGVYKPTNITGGPHPVVNGRVFMFFCHENC